MDKADKIILWFDEITRGDIGIAGGKGANLGEMVNSNIPVPGGFVVTAQAYFMFINETNLKDTIKNLVEPLDPSSTRLLQETASQIMNLISKATMPKTIENEIREAYRKLGRIPVAVRSSATAEDLPEASFAGQQRTFLNVLGEDGVVEAVQGCWASLFESRAIFYRFENGFDHFKVGIAVPVQKMVQSEASGVMFTVNQDPLKGNLVNEISIDAVFGLGETIVSGQLSSDHYVVNKETLKITKRRIVTQKWGLDRNLKAKTGEDANHKVDIPASKQRAQKISDQEIAELARLGKYIESHYQFPQDIEWATEKGKMYIIQTRPITTLNSSGRFRDIPELTGKVLLRGVAASPGMASGPVKMVIDSSEIDRVKQGDILVTEMTTPDFVPAMKKAAAIITDKGGKNSHAAIVSREMGIPCVIATENGSKILKDNLLVTVDAFHGKVFEGRLTDPGYGNKKIAASSKIKTKTKLYVNLAEPERAAEIAAMDVDGIGLLRAEFIIAHHIGEHPRFMIEKGRGSQFTDKLADGITKFTSVFNPRPVVYRMTDFKSNEYKNLVGGDKYEIAEENPMIGYRGCSRYTKESDVLKLEIDAIKKVRREYSNLWVMIPFVRLVSEMADIRDILRNFDLIQNNNFKLWMMAEVPSNVFLINDFLDTGIDGISIGSNDLTQLVLGVDRDNEKFVDKFDWRVDKLDERNKAVLLAIKKLVTTCKKRGVTASICGQAPSVYPELTEKLVKWGVTSVSVTPDMIEETRKIIFDAEAKIKN